MVHELMTSLALALVGLVRSRAALLAENALLRQRVIVRFADGSEVGLGALPPTGIAKPAAVLAGRGVAAPSPRQPAPTTASKP
jgi:hypothetical protein